MSRAEQLDKKYTRVRVTFELETCAPDPFRPIEAWWIEDESDENWLKFDDGQTVPFRLPSGCITDVTRI